MELTVHVPYICTMNIPDTDRKRVVIIGGGFAGISLAKKLKDYSVQLVLIDKHNYHTFQPLLYQVSTAGLEPDSIAYPIRKILRKNQDFYFRWAEVTKIDHNSGKIITSIGDLTYDFLVLAMGTRTNFFGNDEIEKNALPMKSIPHALNIRSLVLQNFEKADILTNVDERAPLLTFCIAGGGPTGVELAGAFAELKKHVFPKDYKQLNLNEMKIHLFEGSDELLGTMSDHSSRKAREFLEELGVQVHLNTRVESYDGHRIKTNNGQDLQTENFIWAAGVTSAVVKGLDPEVYDQKSKRLRVNLHNQVVGYDTVFAIGDIALMSAGDYPEGHPQVAQPAIQQGKLLAKNIGRLLQGKAMKEFQYFDKGSMATIGRNRAVVDLPKRGSFGGGFAWFIWMFVHLMALVGFRNRVVVFFNWMYNYINYDKAARLIVRPFQAKK